MRITFYDTRLDANDMTMLVKEKAVNYDAGKINSPDAVARMMRLLLDMDHLAEEHCYMAAFNNAGRVLGIFLISKGTALQTIVSPREVFIRAFLVGATHIILCHNHPGGEVQPSRHDNLMTQKFREAGELLGITLADHIIIGGDCYLSFSEKGLL